MPTNITATGWSWHSSPGRSWSELWRAIAGEFQALVDPKAPAKPLVGIVGEIYVRQNRYTNQDVVRRIEKAGGEAWLAPISEWILYTSHMEKWLARRNPWWTRIGQYLKDRFLERDEMAWQQRLEPLLANRREPHCC